MNHNLYIPPDACDCHVHVFLPEQFPYAAKRSYTPATASVEALLDLRKRLGTGRTVLVQPSCYATDNSALCAALAMLGTTSARGIAVINTQEVTDDALRQLHVNGVRGLRLNLRTQQIQADDLRQVIQQCHQAADRIRSLGWHLQLHLGAKWLTHLVPSLELLDVPLVLDHFGAGAAAVDSVSRLLAQGNTWVKLSAPYRVSTVPEYADLAAITKHYLKLAPQQLLWASDWPHTGGNGVRNANIHTIEPFRQEDALLALTRLAHWVNNDGLLEDILVHNPERLYGFDESFTLFSTKVSS